MKAWTIRPSKFAWGGCLSSLNILGTITFNLTLEFYDLLGACGPFLPHHWFFVMPEGRYKEFLPALKQTLLFEYHSNTTIYISYNFKLNKI